jgi:hypothetical protein
LLTADFDERTGGAFSGKAEQVDGGFRVTGATQDTAIHRQQGIHVAWLQKVLSSTGGAGEGADCAGTVFGTDAGTGSHVVNGPQKGRFVGGGVAGFFDHRTQTQPSGIFGSDGDAECSAAHAEHEIDLFGSDRFGRTDEVAFVLAVFIVHNDHHPAGLDGPNCLFDGL